MLAGAVTGHSQVPAAGRAAQPSTRPAVTFAETIAPIVYANCVTCHRPGEAAPFSLITYEDVVKRGKLVARVTSEKYMPPWHAAPGHGEFVGERRLTEAQIAAIDTWVKAGMPRGDEAKMPKLPAFPADGWRLGQPDLILEMPAAFDLPASGPDVFRNFVIPTGLTEDKWVRGVEFRPSARKVVHHAIFASGAGWKPGGARRRRWTAGIRRDGDRRRHQRSRRLPWARWMGRWRHADDVPRGPCRAAAQGLRLPPADALSSDREARDGEVAHRDLLRGQRAGQGRVLRRAAGALRLWGRHRHPAGREAVHDSGLVHAAGRRERLLGDGARALSRQGDEGDGHAARRFDEAADLDQRLGLQLAGQLRLQGAVHAAGRARAST